MKLNKISRIAVLVAVAGLAACSSSKKSTDMMDNAGAESYGLGAQADLRNLQGPYSGKAKAGENESFYFGFDQSVVYPMYLKDIQTHANYLLTHPNVKVKLEGNTDARGSREYNVALGWRRADSVAKVLELDGVSKRQIEEVSYGSERPFASGTTDQDYQLNRRVDLVYEK